jgi:hypothetical protein
MGGLTLVFEELSGDKQGRAREAPGIAPTILGRLDHVGPAAIRSMVAVIAILAFCSTRGFPCQHQEATRSPMWDLAIYLFRGPCGVAVSSNQQDTHSPDRNGKLWKMIRMGLGPSCPASFCAVLPAALQSLFAYFACFAVEMFSCWPCRLRRQMNLPRWIDVTNGWFSAYNVQSRFLGCLMVEG